MVKKIIRIILTAILSVAVIVAALTVFVGCKKTEDGGKAIIILPGLMASGLYDSATGEAVWDPFEGDIWFENLMHGGQIDFAAVLPLLVYNESVHTALQNISANDFAGNENSIFNKLAVNEDGTPKVPSVIAADMNFSNPERLRFGAINAYTEMYNAMVESYGDEYEVSVFNYDFRLDNRQGAKKLEEFINGKNYSEVIFLVHSNGGHVASIYLANSQANRDKVSLVCCFDSPLTGSLTALTTLENVDDMVSGVLEIIPEGFSFLSDTIVGAFEKQFKPLVNMYTVYQLLPTYNLLLSPQYTMNLDGEGDIDEESSFIKIKNYGEEEYHYMDFNSPQEIYEFYLSREWAYMSNGEVRPPMASWLDYADASYVKLPDGRKVHSMSLVNTHYIAGKDYPTSCTVLFDEAEDGSLEFTGTETTMHGDSVVLVFGSLEGAPVNKIHIISEADHYDVAQRYDEFSKVMINEIIVDYLASK